MDKTLTDLKNTIAESNRVVSDCFWWFQFSHFGNILQDLGIDGLTSISLENDTATRRKTIRNIKILKLLNFDFPFQKSNDYKVLKRSSSLKITQFTNYHRNIYANY